MSRLSGNSALGVIHLHSPSGKDFSDITSLGASQERADSRPDSRARDVAEEAQEPREAAGGSVG